MQIFKKYPFYVLFTSTLFFSGCPEILDIFPPEVEILSPTNNEEIGQVFTLILSASDNDQIKDIDVIVYQSDSSLVSLKMTEEPWSANFSMQTIGEHRIEVIVTDLVGNFKKIELDIYIKQYFGGDGEINVNSPTFGDSWVAGSTHNISWGSTNVSGNIGIELYKDDIYYNRISNSSANDGSYSWNIPIDIPSGDNYQVAVYSLNDLSLGDFSEYFSISSSSVNSITVSSPDGGESWVLGSTQDITWSSTNVSGYIGIQLYSGDSYVNSISSSSANDGVFSWNIPSTLTPGDDYRVRIYSTSESDIQDYSNSYFSITSSQGGDLPNDDCNIPHSTTGTTFTYVNPEQNIYNFGDTYTAGLYSSLYSVGQQGGAVLRLNGNTVYDFGSWLVFNSDGSYDFTLPAQSSEIVPSNCYTMVIIGYNLQDEYVSEPFTIY